MSAAGTFIIAALIGAVVHAVVGHPWGVLAALGFALAMGVWAVVRPESYYRP